MRWLKWVILLEDDLQHTSHSCQELKKKKKNTQWYVTAPPAVVMYTYYGEAVLLFCLIEISGFLARVGPVTYSTREPTSMAQSPPIWFATPLAIRMITVFGVFDKYVFSWEQAALWMVYSVRLSHLFHYIPIIASSWNFHDYQWPGWGPCKKSRSQGSKPNFSVSGP